MLFSNLFTLHHFRYERNRKITIKQTAGRDILGDFTPEFAHFNDDIL